MLSLIFSIINQEVSKGISVPVNYAILICVKLFFYLYFLTDLTDLSDDDVMVNITEKSKDM